MTEQRRTPGISGGPSAGSGPGAGEKNEGRQGISDGIRHAAETSRAKQLPAVDNRAGIPGAGTGQEAAVSSQFQPSTGWAPPGAQFRTSNNVSRTVAGGLVGLLVTPIGIGLAAHGGLGTRQWVILGDEGDRWSSNTQMIGGALLLFLVALLAAYSPAGTVLAGLVWGLLPGAVQLFSPHDLWRLIEQTPGLSEDLSLALYTWVLNGWGLVLGLLFIGAGLAATLRRR
ncbi:hypothetical protein [Nocardia sp. R7R-8]|uniref:hypothetical protein n=1 Tax=Nocardia sp. R7R-8 TaxID=3459304 RepID=UPI00403E299A